MTTHRGHLAPSGKAEVTIASPPGEAPRLDFSHFSAFGMGDDDTKTALPRSKSSSHIAHSILTTTTYARDHDDMESLDEGSARARSECERGGMGDLIDFLREPPPSDYIQMPSTFDFDLGQLDDDQEEPGKWKQLANKLKKMNPIKPTSPTGTVHIQLKFPEPAVAAKTAEGHRHMAISVPMEHCALGPDSKWAVPAYNATKPLPPSPHRGPRKGSIASRTRSHLSDSITSVDDDALTLAPAAKAVPRMEYGRSHSSIRLWQHNSTPMSPPQSPPSTIASEGRSPGTPSQASRVELPMDPSAYIELTMPSPSSEPMTPESLMEDRVRNITHKIKNTALILQSAPGPPPSSAPRPLPYSSFHPTRPGSSPPSKPQPTKPLPRRPDFKVLPARRSSLKNVTLSAAHKHRNRPSLDEVLNSDQIKRTEIQSTEVEPAIDRPEPSPKSVSCRSLASSILSAESEPVVASARAVRGYSRDSIVLQTTPGTTPRASLIRLSSAENQKSPTSPGETDGSPYRTQRKASTRTNCSRRSRAEKVKSLKQRDMEHARAQMQQRQFENGMKAAAGNGGRPMTGDTVISELRLPSRDGQPETPSLSSFADSFPRPPTADSTKRNERPDSLFMGPSRENMETPTGTNRESYCSSTGGPRRYDSYLRTSWASSIPLLDRISSYAPSERSFMQILDSAAPADSQPHRRSDSATLPRIEQERLTPSRLSRVTSIASNMDGAESKCVSRRASTSSRTVTPGILSAKRSNNRLDDAATPRPTTPQEERWSATTMQSPGVARARSPPPPLSNPSRNERMSPELTPPVSRRGSPEHCTSCGHEKVPERSSMTPFGLEEDARRAALHQVGHIHHGIWSPASLQDLSSHMEDNAQTERYNNPRQQRDSQLLFRMSSAELHAHYDSLHRSDRASDVAHHILLNQERMEFELRRQEQNQKLSFARLMHNQMLFFSELERQLEGMGRSVSGRRKPRASLGWDGLAEANEDTAQPKHTSKSSDTASIAFELEAMDPLMHDLRDGSRVSHECARYQPRNAVPYGPPPPTTMPAAVGGRELDAYFNMI